MAHTDTTEGPSTPVRMIESAIEQIEHGGEAAVRVEAVVAAAGVTKPSLYHFFGDRDGLIIAAQAERYRRALVVGTQEVLDLAMLASTRDEFIGTLETLIHSFGSDDGRRRRRIRAEVLGSAASRPRLAEKVVEMHRAVVPPLVEFFRLGRARGWVTSAVSAEAAAAWSQGLMFSRHIAEIDSEVNLDEWDTLTVDAVMHMLFGPDTRD